MAIRPYANIAKVASLFGGNDAAEVARAADRAQRQFNEYGRRARGIANVNTTGGRQAQRGPGPRARGSVRPGLPGLMGSDARERGATTVRHRTGQMPMIDVQGLPAVRLIENRDHTTRTEVRLSSRYAQWMNEGDLAELRRQAALMERDYRRLSRGRLSYKKLAEMNHPYGHGRFAKPVVVNGKLIQRKRKALPKTLAPKKFRQLGVGSWQVVNRHTGKFERGWKSGARLNRYGAVLQVDNEAEYAGRLLSGTKRMKAHGPFSAVPALHMARIRTMWRDMARRAYLREQAGRVR